MNRRPLAVLPLFACALVLPLLGCAPITSPYMSKVQNPQRPQTATDTATVVFMRPSKYLPGLGVIIFDPQARALAVSMPASYVALKVPPGDTTFHVISSSPTALRATLTAGRIYYVEVSAIGYSMATGPNLRLLALTPRAKYWSKVSEWMAASEELTPNIATMPELQKTLENTRNLNVPSEIQRNLAALAGYDAEHLEARTLRAEDGQQQ